MRARERNPWVHYSEVAAAPETVVDVRNNLMWDISGAAGHHGTVVFGGTKANIVNNYYKAVDSADDAAEQRAIVVCQESGMAAEDVSFCEDRSEFPPARAYVAGNFSVDGWTDHINAKGTESRPFPAPAVTTTDACTAAKEVLASAGVRTPDATEKQYLSSISITCDDTPEPSLEIAPGRLDFSAFIGGSNPPSKTLNLSHSTGGSAAWTAASDAPWLSISPASGTTPSNTTVAVNSSGLSEGSYPGSLRFDAPSVSGSPYIVPVTLRVSAAPQITSPKPGSVLPGSEVTFGWTKNGSVKNWRLHVGSAQGAKDLHDSGNINGSRTSRTVRRLPTDGRPIWVQLRFHTDSGWQFTDFRYTAEKQ